LVRIRHPAHHHTHLYRLFKSTCIFQTSLFGDTVLKRPHHRCVSVAKEQTNSWHSRAPSPGTSRVYPYLDHCIAHLLGQPSWFQRILTSSQRVLHFCLINTTFTQHNEETSLKTDKREALHLSQQKILRSDLRIYKRSHDAVSLMLNLV